MGRGAGGDGGGGLHAIIIIAMGWHGMIFSSFELIPAKTKVKQTKPNINAIQLY